jgi:hypothetical protein
MVRSCQHESAGVRLRDLVGDVFLLLSYRLSRLQVRSGFQKHLPSVIPESCRAYAFAAGETLRANVSHSPRIWAHPSPKRRSER